MDRKTELLGQLKLDRGADNAPPVRTRWGLVVVAAVAGAIVAALISWQLLGRSADSHAGADARPPETAGSTANADSSTDNAAASAPSSATGGDATTTAPGSAASLLDASGYVVALRQATVSGKSIYRVDAVLIEEGQHVQRGQIIARLDDSNVRAALEQSQAQVKQMQASLAAAQLAAADAQPIFERDRRQLAQGLISQDAFDQAKASNDAAHIAVMVAEQNLAVAKATVTVNQRFEDDTVIRAPFDGVVTVKTAQPGEIVSPQFQGGGGIAQIVDMNSLEVDVDVSENYINRVHAGQPATVRLDAYPNWNIPAQVIAIIPTADRSKATVKVRVGLLQKDARIVPEMGARVSFLGDGAHRP